MGKKKKAKKKPIINKKDALHFLIEFIIGLILLLIDKLF